MPTNLPALAHYIAAPTLSVPDGEFLRRFAEYRDEEAFAELVSRNGPLVLRACRSVLRDPASIDDAFQATFIQLVRHAARLTASPSLAGWLHKAAVRAAGALRRAEFRRHRREQVARSIPNSHSPDDLTWLEVRELIDIELARLPEKYRLPLLLCYLEGMRYEDAAIRLGCSLGALRGRLERGRELLRKRLERRGLPAVALALGVCSPPAVSAALRSRTLEVVTRLGAGPDALLSWNGLTLHGKLFFAGCVAVLVAIGVGLGAFHNSADGPKGSPAVPIAPPAVTEKTSASLVDAFGDPLPHGAVARLGTRRFWQNVARDIALSPDGKTVALGDGGFTLLDAVTGQVIRHENSVVIGGYFTMPVREGSMKTNGIMWRPDGRGVALVWASSDPAEMYLWDFTDPKDIPPTRKPSGITLWPSGEGAVSCVALSPDGAWVAIARQSSDSEKRVVEIYRCKTGKRLSDLKIERTLGPFSANCERIWFTADGREMVLAFADNTAIAIDAANGKELHRITLPRWAVIAASPDGKFVAVIPRSREERKDVWHTGDEKVLVWDLTSGKEVWTLPRPGGPISGLQFTPDSKQLVTSDAEHEFRKWDMATGKEVASRPVSTGLNGMSVVSISADGKRYATARNSTPIKVWDAATGKHLNPLSTHQDVVAGVAASPDSRLIATLGYDGTLRIWNVATGKQVSSASAPRANPKSVNYGSHRNVAFTPDGRGIIFDAAGVLSMIDAMTGKPLDLPGGLKQVPGAVGGFSTDGKALVSFSKDVATLWDWPAGTARQTFRVALEKPRLWGPPPKDPLMSVIKNTALSPDGSTLLTVSNLQTDPIDAEFGPNSTDCWDVKTGKRRSQFAPDLWYPQFVFSPDGRTLYIGGQPSDPEALYTRVRREGLASYDVSTGTIIRRFDDPLDDPRNGERHVRSVRALALSRDGRLLAVSEGENAGTVWIHETASGRVVRRFEGHEHFIYSLAFTPDGSKLISVSYDKTGLVWDVSLPTFTDRKAGPLTPKELADSWGRLAAPDPVLAWRAVADLAGSPAEGVAFLADRLKPPPVLTATDLDRIEKQLEAPEFADREKATAELDAYGPNAVALVKERIKKTDSTEVAARLAEFLKRHAGERASQLVLRETRGVAALEAIGSPDARKVLANLASTRPAGQLAVDAAAALARLEKLGGGR